ncbi:DsbA family oxidoreductase [Ornithinimicrobium avium]|uniref:DsbA family oxidoreductase n=1 Tax=Ornithinimicrobium avium TaxID=2283195 RepID=A0A345NNK0_9MICO|nr:DsbA family oxidoreductase [Ornithinimicrobium avium]AXH96608.1 DsbA family oxidoreductase [Ornithinimicrobium avium]
MRIDVWSDILCPFCHLGRRNLQLALEQFEHADEVSVIWHSFQLDPEAPERVEGSNVERIAQKYGISVEDATASQEQLAADAAAAGLDYQWQKSVGGNSYDAHRLIHFARFQGVEEQVTERIMRAWYSEGASIGEKQVLLDLAVEAGLDTEEVRGVLESDSFGHEVRSDLAVATQIGISSVPTFVLDQKFGVPGAQPVDVMLNAIRYAWEDQGNTAGGGGCGCGGCGCGGGAEESAPEAAAQSAPEPEPAAAGGCGSGACGCG